MLSYDSLNSKEAPSGTPSASNRRFCSTFFKPFVSRPRCWSAARRSLTGIFMMSIGWVGSGFLSFSGTISGRGALVPSFNTMEPRTGVAVSTAIFLGFAEKRGFARRPRLKETPKLPPSTEGVAGAGGGACAACPVWCGDGRRRASGVRASPRDGRRRGVIEGPGTPRPTGGVSAFPYTRAPLLSTETGSSRSSTSLPSSSRCLHNGLKGVRLLDVDFLTETRPHNLKAASSTGSGHLSSLPGCT